MKNWIKNLFINDKELVKLFKKSENIEKVPEDLNERMLHMIDSNLNDFERNENSNKLKNFIIQRRKPVFALATILVLAVPLWFILSKSNIDRYQSIIVFKAGTVNIIRNNKVIPAKVGEKIFKSDIVKTEENSFCKIDIAKNTNILILEKNTELQVSKILSETEKNTLINLLNGKLFINSKKLSKKNTFAIKTGKTISEIKGTKFIVETNANKKTTVSVKEGAVKTTIKKSNKEIVLKQDEVVSSNQQDLKKIKFTKNNQKSFNFFDNIDSIKNPAQTESGLILNFDNEPYTVTINSKKYTVYKNLELYLQPGKYQVNIEKESAESYSETIDLNEKQFVTANFKSKIFEAGEIISNKMKNLVQTKIFTLNTKEMWANSNIFINQGDAVYIECEGTFTIGSNERKMSAKGRRETSSSKKCNKIYSQASLGSVLLKYSQNKNIYNIGEKKLFKAQHTGELLFAVNDCPDSFFDNIGNIKISVKIKKKPKVEILEKKQVNEKIIKIPYKKIAEFNNHNYYLSTERVSWHQAKSLCEKYNGYIVTITSFEEKEVIEKAINQNRNIIDTSIWMGLTDEDQEGNWKWITNEKLDYNRWMMNQPDNAKVINHPRYIEEDFAVISYHSSSVWWYDASGKNEFHFILETED